MEKKVIKENEDNNLKYFGNARGMTKPLMYQAVNNPDDLNKMVIEDGNHENEKLEYFTE